MASRTPATATATAPSSSACDKCGKTQDQLSKPLKACAKCGHQKYCSRDCQKAAYSTHRKDCARLASTRATDGVPDSLTHPPKSEIIAGANATIDLLVALMSHPNFNPHDVDATHPPVLMHMIDFTNRTFHEYFRALLPADMCLDLTMRIPKSIPVEERRAEMERRLAIAEELSEGKFQRNVWPDFKTELYSDGLSRNWTAAMIVRDGERRKVMFAGMEPEGWGFGAEIEGVAERMMKRD